MVFVNMNTLQEITGIGKNITEISILGENKDSSILIKNSLIKSINNSNLEILSWEDMMPGLVSAIALFETMMIIFFAIVFITVIFSVANTLVMSIMERFHELGVMKSIGTRPVQIFNIIIFEAINLGIAGLLTGVIFSSLIIGILSIVGIDLSIFSESMRAFGTGSILYPFLTIKDIVTSILLVLLTTLIAALYPAIKAARIKPLDALNYI
jgi:ABC-type lipoprotein release transport system permease subunit